jgi:hypothetical protein
MAYWWCTDHKTVEGDQGCRAEVRLGPYPTAEAAQHALESVAERNAQLDAEDEAWEERGER